MSAANNDHALIHVSGSLQRMQLDSQKDPHLTKHLSTPTYALRIGALRGHCFDYILNPEDACVLTTSSIDEIVKDAHNAKKPARIVLVFFNTLYSQISEGAYKFQWYLADSWKEWETSLGSKRLTDVALKKLPVAQVATYECPLNSRTFVPIASRDFLKQTPDILSALEKPPKDVKNVIASKEPNFTIDWLHLSLSDHIKTTLPISEMSCAISQLSFADTLKQAHAKNRPYNMALIWRSDSEVPDWVDGEVWAKCEQPLLDKVVKVDFFVCSPHETHFTRAVMTTPPFASVRKDLLHLPKEESWTCAITGKKIGDLFAATQNKQLKGIPYRVVIEKYLNGTFEIFDGNEWMKREQGKFIPLSFATQRVFLEKLPDSLSWHQIDPKFTKHIKMELENNAFELKGIQLILWDYYSSLFKKVQLIESTFATTDASLKLLGDDIHVMERLLFWINIAIKNKIIDGYWLLKNFWNHPQLVTFLSNEEIEACLDEAETIFSLHPERIINQKHQVSHHFLNMIDLFERIGKKNKAFECCIKGVELFENHQARDLFLPTENQEVVVMYEKLIEYLKHFLSKQDIAKEKDFYESVETHFLGRGIASYLSYIEGRVAILRSKIQISVNK